MMDCMKGKAQQGKDKASEARHSAKDRAHEKKDQTGSYLCDKTGAATDNLSDTA